MISRWTWFTFDINLVDKLALTHGAHRGEISALNTS